MTLIVETTITMLVVLVSHTVEEFLPSALVAYLGVKDPNWLSLLFEFKSRRQGEYEATKWIKQRMNIELEHIKTTLFLLLCNSYPKLS